MTKLYYTPPTDEIFEEVKQACMDLWQDVGDQQSYIDEKVSRIKDIKNIQDNFMYMIAMFDDNNQRALSRALTFDASLAIRERMIDGGTPLEYIYF
jgi:hypothetical protein